MLSRVRVPSIQRFLGSLGIPGLPGIVLVSAALCLIGTSHAIQLLTPRALSNEHIYFAFWFCFLSGFCLVLGKFTSNFGSFQMLTIYGQDSFSEFAKMKCDDYRKMNYGRETRRAGLLIPLVHKLAFAACDTSNYPNLGSFHQGVTCAQRSV